MHQIPKCFSSLFAIVFAQSNEARCLVENEDVVGAAPTGDASTTSEWSTILLLIKVELILETWWYVFFNAVEKYDNFFHDSIQKYDMDIMCAYYWIVLRCW